jgi:hypothetical protein
MEQAAREIQRVTRGGDAVQHPLLAAIEASGGGEDARLSRPPIRATGRAN